MASTRTARQGPAKPRGAKKQVAPPRERLVPLDVLPVIEEEEEEIPTPPEEPVCDFPLEMRKGRCPVAVFNSPESMNESIAFPVKDYRNPIKFDRGVLAIYDEEDVPYVRQANVHGSLYVEADPRFGAEPLRCTTCFPPTRWYSSAAFQRHMRRHGGG